MTSASLPTFVHISSNEIEVDVWLEAGREGKTFTYSDRKNLGVQLGDLVLVRLKGRLVSGLVVGRRISRSVDLGKQFSSASKRSLYAVEDLVQSAAITSEWTEWIELIANRCYCSTFRMLKAALPPGWLGQRPAKNPEPRSFWWIQLESHSKKIEELSKRQSDLYSFLSLSGGGSWQKDLQANGFSSAVIQGLISKGFVKREQRLQSSEKLVSFSGEKYSEDLELSKRLTDEQRNAVIAYKNNPPGSSLLLWGVTGSGKTEVYLHIVEEELKAGRNCLVLTPEIGLIPQLFDRFKSRFGARVLEYHSGCSNRERIRTWCSALESEIPLVVVGTRSAIFLPLNPLGLIVLDEEHDSSYKQSFPMPCYHARDVAIGRAERTGAKVILGSATPSLWTWKNIEPSGNVALARLERRISAQSLPPVYVVDMRNEFSAGHRRLISRPLMKRIQQLPEKGEQAVILVPRRGYSSFLSCRSCGEVVQCPHCDVALTVHRGNNQEQWLRCHWCDHREMVRSSCHNCGSKAFKPFGAGTQRVLEHLSKELEGLRFMRFDRDSTGGRDGHRFLLEQFAAGKADVLVGTQMLAKGMDLPRVTLAAVLAADGLLHRPDLQASEESLQLLMQLAGRAGRGELAGEVLVQTYCPDHPVIAHLVDGSYESFLHEEEKLRKEANMVPYSRACLLKFSGESASSTATAASVLAEHLRPICKAQGWSLIGPAPAMITKVAGKSRWQLLLHGPEESALPLPEGNVLWKALPRGVSLSVDPDPIQL